MRQYLASLWFKLTGKYPESGVQSRAEAKSSARKFSPHRGHTIGGIELKSLGIDTRIGDLDERELYPHAFQNRDKSHTDDPDTTASTSPRDLEELIADNARKYDEKAFGDEEDDGTGRFVAPRQPIPDVTVGSILTWGLIKTALLVVIIWFVVEQYNLHQYWYVGLGVFWFIVAYPAFLQYQRFKEQTHHLEKNSLCATCRHFDPTGHFCRQMDEHVSETYIPCEGLKWEGKEK